METHDVELIQNYLLPLIGQAPWSVWLGIGSFITLEFGTAKQKYGRLIGEWNLWIQHSTWRIESLTTVIVASEDPREKIDEKIKVLEWQEIVSIDVLAPSLEASIRFGKGFVLRIFPYTTEDYTHWELFTPENHVLVAGPGANWKYQRSDEPLFRG